MIAQLWPVVTIAALLILIALLYFMGQDES